MLIDNRLKKLAQIIVNYSLKVKQGEKVLVKISGIELAFMKMIVDTIYDAGGLPFVMLEDQSLERSLLMKATREQLDIQAEYERVRMEAMDCYIGITGWRNLSALSDVPAEKMELYHSTVWKKVHVDVRLAKRWVVLRYPTAAMAQMSKMSEEAFEDWFFEACVLDYEKMSNAMNPLVDLMSKTDIVRITGPGTDLTFSIKGSFVEKADGIRNIPDGEVNTYPVIDSVEGVISYNSPGEYDGFMYSNVKLKLKNGKIIEASANDTSRINNILDTDPGARYIGEFALGINPKIIKPTMENLFDEKISGSLHFTPGNCVKPGKNHNHSAIHWDLVLIQTEEYGGGEIWFDGKLVRKNGLFVLPELELLNPVNLI